MGQAVMDTTIIGQQQQAGGILVQSTHRINARGDINQIHHNLLAGMAAAGHIIFGFVHGDIYQRLRGLDGFPIDFNPVLVRINFGAEFNDDVTVYADPAGFYEFLALSAGTNPGSRQEFLESH